MRISNTKLEIIKWAENKKKHNSEKLIRIASKASNMAMAGAQSARRMRQLWASSFKVCRQDTALHHLVVI